MTPAEAELLKCALEVPEGGPRWRTDKPPGAFESAVAAVLRERSSPEARDKFFALYERNISAARAFSACCNALPRPLMLEWYAEAEKAFEAKE